MKRSQINQIMKDAVLFAQDMKFQLPPFAYFPADKWKGIGKEWQEVKDNMLGWDITDFGSGDFDHEGLFMFTIRNGNLYDDTYVKPYAEKLLIVKEGQLTPYHFHFNKMEDIINRGGGILLVKIYESTEDEQLSDGDVTISTDGRNYTAPAGTVVRLAPGESITLKAGQYHSFWGEEGTGTILVGEVSKLNDDRVDNRFLKPTGRFPEIEEDEAPLYLLCNEYPEF